VKSVETRVCGTAIVNDLNEVGRLWSLRQVVAMAPKGKGVGTSAQRKKEKNKKRMWTFYRQALRTPIMQGRKRVTCRLVENDGSA